MYFEEDEELIPPYTCGIFYSNTLADIRFHLYRYKEVETWLNENVERWSFTKMPYQNSTIIYDGNGGYLFLNKEDAMRFKLVWWN